jgi:hypothetical protein
MPLRPDPREPYEPEAGSTMTEETPAPRSRPPSLFDRIARVVALVALVIIFTVIFWIPLELVRSPFSAPLVLAIVTLAAINLASRLHRLRERVAELEARLPPPQK